MTTKHETFEARVAAMEKLAGERPRTYRMRVTAFALLGYGFLALVVTGLLALLAAALASIVFLKFVGVKIAVVIAALVWLVLRSLVVRIAPPAGIALKPRDAPDLFRRIEDLRRAIGAPRFHRVVVNEDFNAAVAQVPVFGPFGWHRNHLVLGLPLMRSLHPRQLDAVLAHELGHLAGGHARLGNWLYRLRMIWTRLLDELHRAGHRGNGPIRRFFDWYVPRFNAYSFPLARANEYEADAISARVTSPGDAAEALTAVHAVGGYLEERFWPGLLAHADNSPQPSFAPYSGLGDSIGEAVADGTCQDALRRALAQETTSANTHPALKDRLHALGAEPKLALPDEKAAAWQLLGAKREGITRQLDRRWQDLVAHDWRMRHEHVQQARSRLAELDEASSIGDLDVDTALERARLSGAYGENRDAMLIQLRALHERAGHSAIVNHALGIHLLERDDEAGRTYVEQAIRLDSAAAASGYAALRDFHWRRDEVEAAHDYHALAIEAAAEDEEDRAERARLEATDRMMPSGLDAKAIATLASRLRQVGGIRRAWIGRKQLQVRPHVPLYVLGFCLERSWRIGHERRERAIRDGILQSLELPGEVFVLCVDHGLARRIGAALSEYEEAVIPL